jgi:hypothetical protein
MRDGRKRAIVADCDEQNVLAKPRTHMAEGGETAIRQPAKRDPAYWRAYRARKAASGQNPQAEPWRDTVLTRGNGFERFV